MRWRRQRIQQAPGWRLLNTLARLLRVVNFESSALQSDMAAPSAIEQFYRGGQAARKQRSERQRDVLFGAGCGLLCFGLFPFSASATVGSASSGETSTAFRVDEFDAMTRTLSMAFSLVGLVCATLSCVVIARTKLRIALACVAVPLVGCVLISGRIIIQYSMADDVVNVLRHTHEISLGQEMRLERTVNEIYCDAQAKAICASGDIARAKSAFGIYSWRDMDSACSRVRKEDVPTDLEPLNLISSPASKALRWCGHYVASSDMAVDTSESLYQQHRAEVLTNLLHVLAWRKARIKLLIVLEWFGVPALVAVVWWWKSSTSKAHQVEYQPMPMHIVV